MKIYSYISHTFIGGLLSKDSVVIDVGANKGEFVERIRRAFDCYVYAIEPIPELLDKIRPEEKTKKFNLCIMPRNGLCKLHFTAEECATIYQDGGEIVGGRTISVDGITLGFFLRENNINQVDLLKIDIEGAELEFFESLDVEALEKINQIAVEFHDFIWPDMHDRVEKIKRDLGSWGFYCIPFSIFNNGDVLFVKKTAISKIYYLYLKYILRYSRGIARRIGRIF